jgi:exodeoxyribonuclease V alpha subunit
LNVTDTPLRRLTDVVRQLSEQHPREMFDTVNYQIITPQRKGKAGTFALNKVLCGIFHDPGADGLEVEYDFYTREQTGIGSIEVRVGQKVLINQNLYDLRSTMDERYEHDKFIPPAGHQQVFNGESGVVTSVDDGVVTIDLGDRIISVPPFMEFLDNRGALKAKDPRQHIEHAYAITTHKAQGSEYTGVIYFVSQSASFNQCQANFYTAITRAKSQVLVIGDKKSVGFFSLKKKAGFPQVARKVG